MKYFRNTILLLLLLALLPACSNEEEVPGNPGELRLTLSVPGAKLTRSTTSLSGESTLSGICLLFYPQGAAGTEQPAFFYRNAGVSKDNGSWNNIFKARDLSGLTDGAAYDVYALASLPDATEVPDWKTTKDDFLALREKQFNRTDAAAPGISFSGTASYTHNSSAAATLSIELVRTVARLDITLVNAPDGVSGNVTGEPLYTFYRKGQGEASEERISSPLLKTGAVTPDAGTTPGMKTYRAYIYENPATAAKPVSIEFIVGGLSYTAEVKPAGSNEIKRNHIYSVNLRIEDEKLVALTGPALDWEEVVPDEAIPDPILPQPRANAYIIAPNGPSISIPVDQANEAHAHISNVDEIKAGESLTAELVWTDVKGAVSNKGLAPDAAITHFYVAGTGPDARLVVKPGSQPGNAVIAVKSKSSGSIRWSWHIWVTDYDPETEAGQKSINGYVFMDRNLGAMSAEPALNNANGVVGNYYQWGRKDPFPTKSRGTAALTFTPVYGEDGWDKNLRYVSKTTMAQTVVEPFVVCSTNGTYLPAAATADPTKVWNKDGEKTAFDPCPPGWRVPVKDAYADLDVNLVPLVQSGGANVGYYQEQCGFFPFTWDLSYPNATLINNGYFYCWTANANVQNNVTAHGIHNMGPTIQDFSYGLTVRCVRDWAKGKLANEVRVMSIGGTGLSTGHQLGPNQSNFARQLPLRLTNANFGPGAKMNAVFKYYNYHTTSYTDQVWLDIIKLMDENEIDVVFLCGVKPAAKNTKLIKDWVDAKSTRVLIAETDDASNVAYEICKQYNINSVHTYGQYNSVLTGYDSPLYRRIETGLYGSVKGSTFGHITVSSLLRTELETAGFVPIFQTSGPSPARSGLSIHPTSRVIFSGDNAFLYEVGNANGSLAANGYGNFPVLWANIWAWIAETALQGR